MPVKKSGLGKGLDSLIPNKNVKSAKPSVKADEKKAAPKEEILEAGPIMVKINKVEPNREQPRKDFDEDALMELADSIKQFGVLQPILVQKKKDYYEIIAGERRWRAAKLAGLKEVPVVIKDYSPQEIMEVALIENIQREDLNPVEEAKAYQNLIKEYNLKQEEVAERVSKSRSAITNSLRLLKLSDDVLTLLMEEEISSGHARALLGLEDSEKQLEIAEKIAKDHLSVREVEKLVKNINQPAKKTKKKELSNDFLYHDMEEKVKLKTGTKVRINRKSENKGKIEIEYYSQDDLEKILGYFK